MPVCCAGAQRGGEVVVDDAHVPRDELADLAVLAGLRDPLDPEVRHQRLLPACCRVRKRQGTLLGQQGEDLLPGARQQLARRGVEGGTELVPRRVEARGPEVSLRVEVAVEDGLAHARLACDLGGRRARIAAGREDAQSGLHDRPPALVGRKAAWTTHGPTLVGP